MTRLIDADALLEEISKYNSDYFKYIKKIITNAPTVEREGWVSVELNAKRHEWFKNNYLKYGNGDSDISRPIILFNGKWYGGHFNNIDDLDSAIDEIMISAAPKE